MFTDLGRDIQTSVFEGRQLVAQTRIVNLGTVRSGEQVWCSFDVRNIGLDSVRVLGIEADCACMVSSDVPFSLSPFAKRAVRITVSVPHVACTQDVWHLLRVLPDCDGGKGPIIRLTMRVEPAQALTQREEP